MFAQFSESDVRSELNQLPWLKAAAFSAACAQRLLPGYILFTNEAGVGDRDSLSLAVELAWRIAEGGVGKEATTALQQLLGACELAAPDEEAYDTFLASLARDTALGVSCMIDSLLDKSREGFVQTARYVTDSVDLYIQETEGILVGSEGLEERIHVHPLMQQELSRQRRDLDLLSGSAANGVRELLNVVLNESAFDVA